MRADEDIAAEARQLTAFRGMSLSQDAVQTGVQSAAPSYQHTPLNWKPNAGGHRPNTDTRRLLQEAGGREALVRFTTIFYKRCFVDKKIDKLIRSHDDPHGERFADWITEKFGAGQPWTEERATRKVCPFSSHGHQLETPHDRSSAHFAAWHSPKRSADEFGQHFKLDDCRNWMRLHFWAMREAGITERSPGFADYYVRFIGHFVSVYERTATQFARDSARWSADPSNIEAYLKAGNEMQDIIGVPLRLALQDLPPAERGGEWPYEY